MIGLHNRGLYHHYNDLSIRLPQSRFAMFRKAFSILCSFRSYCCGCDIPIKRYVNLSKQLWSQVSPGTSLRRDAVINITNTYALKHPEIQVHLRRRGNLLPYEWHNLLQRSKFTICPGGHNAETYRMYEALETGWGMYYIYTRRTSSWQFFWIFRLLQFGL